MIQRRRVVFLLGATILALTMLAGSPLFAEPSGTWARGADLGTGRGWAGGAAADELFYVIGGSDSLWHMLSVVEAYDPGADTWTPRADMPTARCGFATVALDGRIYVFGGLSGSSESLATLEVYDPATDTWSTAADMPTPRAFAGAAALDGLIYVIGGKPEGYFGPAVAAVEVYDPTADSWGEAASLADPRYACTAAALDGAIYAIGGRIRDQSSTRVERYDPVTNSWEIAPALQFARCGPPSATVIDNAIYVFGGNDADADNTAVPWVEVFTTDSGVWQVKGRMPSPRCGFGIGIVDGLVYLGGGFDPHTASSLPWLTVYDADAYSYWADVAAHLPGSFGSLWRTDIAAVNSGDDQAEVTVILHSPDTPGSLSRTIDPGAQMMVEDVVGEMGVTGKGTLEVRSTQPLSVSGRTFTDEGDGTFGQFCDLVSSDVGLIKGDEVWLPGLRQQTGRFRTNLAFANTGLWRASLLVRLHGSDGTLLTSYLIMLQPGELLQDLQPFVERAGIPDVGSGYASVSVGGGHGVMVSASVVDSRTNDATTVTAKRR